jgi:hypothetical protein
MKRVRLMPVCLALLAWSGLAAETKDLSYETDLGIQASTILEAKLTLSENWRIPVLTGEDLFADNRLDIKLSQEVSPVSANLGFDAVFTPIAFLQFNVGALIGTGWPLLEIGNGIGLVSANPDGTTRTDKVALQNLMYKFKVGGAFQFDLAAVAKGDWNHVVFRTYHELWYRALTGLSGSDTFQYENDDGLNRAGWNYYGNYLLGYQMPIFVDTVAFLLEVENRLYSMAGSDNWGEGNTRYNFGPLVNFKFGDHFSIAALVQWHSQPNYLGNGGALFYQYRQIDAANPLSIVFNRVALSANIIF